MPSCSADARGNYKSQWLAFPIDLDQFATGRTCPPKLQPAARGAGLTHSNARFLRIPAVDRAGFERPSPAICEALRQGACPHMRGLPSGAGTPTRIRREKSGACSAALVRSSMRARSAASAMRAPLLLNDFVP